MVGRRCQPGGGQPLHGQFESIVSHSLSDKEFNLALHLHSDILNSSKINDKNKRVAMEIPRAAAQQLRAMLNQQDERLLRLGIVKLNRYKHFRRNRLKKRRHRADSNDSPGCIEPALKIARNEVKGQISEDNLKSLENLSLNETFHNPDSLLLPLNVLNQVNQIPLNSWPNSDDSSTLHFNDNVQLSYESSSCQKLLSVSPSIKTEKYMKTMEQRTTLTDPDTVMAPSEDDIAASSILRSSPEASATTETDGGGL